MDEKSYENILVYKISYKNLIGAKSMRIRLDKIDGFIRIYNGKRYLVLKNMMPFTIGLHTLLVKKIDITYVFL